MRLKVIAAGNASIKQFHASVFINMLCGSVQEIVSGQAGLFKVMRLSSV